MFCKQEDMFVRIVNHIHVMYCQDYPRFPKINSNELYRKGHLERERDDLYPGKEKKSAKSSLPSKYPQLLYIERTTPVAKTYGRYFF